MPAARKDNKGRALRKGEVYQESRKMYVYTFTDPLGRRQYVYAKDLLRLREKEQQLLKDQLDGLDVYSAGKSSLNFVFDRYIKSRPDLRKTTHANYVYTYDQYVRKDFGRRKITDIKYSDLVFFYIYLIQDLGLSVSTADNVNTVLNPTFKLAVRDEIIRNNPNEGALTQVKKTLGKGTGVRNALTKEQQTAFLDFIRDTPQYHRWLPIYTLLLGTGCRVGEAVGLRWEDVDLEEGMISINHTVSYFCRRDGDSRCEYTVSPPKTGAGTRTIPILSEVKEAILMERELQDAIGICCEQEIDGMSGFIFCNRYGNVHKASGLNRVIRRICEDYNLREELAAKRENRKPVMLPHFSCHHLRHTFCTRLCENVTNIKVIQSIMGHADITTTMNIYAEVHDGVKKEMFTDLAEELNMF